MFRAASLFLETCQDDYTAQEKTSLRPDILGEDHGLTPLAGALFRGDASLVEAVLKACGKKPLTRDEVCDFCDACYDRVGGSTFLAKRILTGEALRFD